MIDFNYYINFFNGKIISDIEEFDRLKDRAVRYIKTVISCAPLDEDIADAVCALCEFYCSTDSSTGIKSESVDGMSITYDNINTEKSAYNILKLYLPKKLLYRGI